MNNAQPAGELAAFRERRDGGSSLPASRLAQVDARCVSLFERDSYASGRYQQLRSMLPHPDIARPETANGKGMVVAVTSPSAGDGKTLTSINLAGACARNPDYQVLIVDVDLRRKHESLSAYFGLSPQRRSHGLTGALQNPNGRPYPAFRIDKCPNLSVLPRGRRDANAYELLESAAFGHFIEQARSFYQYVVLDAPPVLPVPDSNALSRWVDGFLLIVNANRTPRKAVTEAMLSLGKEKTLGLVLNRCEPMEKRYYRYYGTYGD
jgi:capsular exopolysaccharide synthesis family protein